MTAKTLRDREGRAKEKTGAWAARAFPLHMRSELEVPLNQTGFVVGVNRDYPARLREMLSAAAITYQLMNRSIDHVRRTYLKNMTYDEDPGGETRLDRKIRGECLAVATSVDEVMKTYPPLLAREPLLGEWAGDITIQRTGYSLERAFAEADKGALYESVVIARMMLEQCCWAYAIRQLDDLDKIRSMSIGHCVSVAKRGFPGVARLYGWMSRHAHWDHEAQLKALAFDGEYAGIMLASSEFKALAYCLLLVLTCFYGAIVDRIVTSMRTRALKPVKLEWRTGYAKFRPAPWFRLIAENLLDVPDVRELLAIYQVGITRGAR